MKRSALLLLCLSACAQSAEHGHLTVSAPPEFSAATSDAIAEWNQAAGVELFELVSPPADITIRVGSVQGDADTIGVTRGYDVTITGVMPFETIRHELGHTLGIGHETDDHSVMNQYIRTDSEITAHSLRYANIVWETL